MKLKTLAAAFIVTTSFASAYTVSVTNQITFGDPSLVLVDNTGAPLTSGVVAVGYFASDAAVTGNSTDFTSLLTGFNSFGSSVALSGGLAPGLVDLPTPAAWTVSVPAGTAGNQVGQNVYVLIGNAATLAESTGLAVWKSTRLFATEDDLGNGGVLANLSTGQGALLLGESGGSQLVGGAINYADSIRLVTADAVPEPSTSLLAGLAGLALAFRRRR